MSASLYAQQNAPVFRSNTAEIGGFVGASYGIDETRVMGGGNVCYSLIPALMPFAEYSYFPGIQKAAATFGIPGATSSYSLPIQDVNFGLHLRVPKPRWRVIPYAVVSFGLIHNGAHTDYINIPANPPYPAQNNVPEPISASTSFAASFGGGIRYYASEHYGFRVEVKAYKPTGNLITQVFSRVAFGFFYQF
jgi:hypothetical protein